MPNESLMGRGGEEDYSDGGICSWRGNEMRRIIGKLSPPNLPTTDFNSSRRHCSFFLFSLVISQPENS